MGARSCATNSATPTLDYPLNEPTHSLRKSALPALSPKLGSDLVSNPTETSGVAVAGIAPLPGEKPVGGAPLPSSVSTSEADLGILFKPTEAMVRVKARFWAKWGMNPLQAPGQVTLATAQQMTQSAALGAWWPKPGFVTWFCNTSVTEERLDYLLHLALSSAEDILLNTDPKAQSARVQMVKIVAEMAGKLKGAPTAGPAVAEAKKRQAIEAMSKTELVSFLKDQGISVQQVVTVEATPPPTN